MEPFFFVAVFDRLLLLVLVWIVERYFLPSKTHLKNRSLFILRGTVRGNYPLGYVKEGTATYTSTNNSTLGECASSGYTGTCFELPDYLKGDLARTYFYLATAYYGVWGCCDEAGVDKWEMKKWMEDDMRAWHEADPVTDQERARNEEIYANHQHNRNPYIDHPEWVNQITDF